jgi:hypothetical protein
MRGTIPPLPNTPPWRGVQLKNTEVTLLHLTTFRICSTEIVKKLTTWQQGTKNSSIVKEFFEAEVKFTFPVNNRNKSKWYS